MKIWCCGCQKEVNAWMITGNTCYPHRPDLYELTFWQCPHCKNFVGSHKKTLRPLGVIATKEIKTRRHKIHEIIDPLWQQGYIKRKTLYKIISDELGYEYHTAETKSMDELDKIEQLANKLAKQFNQGGKQ